MKIKEFIMSNKLILMLEFYLLFTFLLYVTGPFKYSYTNWFKMLFLVIVYQAALFTGYYLAKKYDKGNDTYRIISSKKKTKIIVLIIIVLSIIINYTHIAYIINDYNLINIIKVVIISITGLGEAYLTNIDRAQYFSENGHLITKIYTLSSPLLHLGIVYSFMKFKELARTGKILVIINLLFTIALPLVKGQNFGVFSIILTLVTILLLSINHKFVNKKSAYITIIILFLGFLIYFSAATIGRLKPSDTLTSLYGVNINSDNWMFQITPKVLHNPIILINAYLTQGYHGMSIALSESFTSTYGLGNGYFSLRIANSVFGFDLFEKTYMAKISEFWHPTINWHTAYTWFANDVSYYGVIIIMLAVGFLLYQIVRFALAGDIIAISLLPLYIIMLIFLPMNNVILGNSTTAFQFISLNVMFFISRVKNVMINY